MTTATEVSTLSYDNIVASIYSRIQYPPVLLTGITHQYHHSTITRQSTTHSRAFTLRFNLLPLVEYSQ